MKTLRLGIQFFGKKKSSAVAYFINTGTTAAPVWAKLGKGVTSLPIDYGAQTTTEAYIDEDNATTSVDSYQVSAGIDVAIWEENAAHAYLEKLRKDRAVGTAAETQILEVFDITGTSPYAAQLNNAAIALGTFTVEGGKPQTLSVTIYFNDDPTDGTVVITAGVPVFTAA
jgi:hypothetical protein